MEAFKPRVPGNEVVIKPSQLLQKRTHDYAYAPILVTIIPSFFAEIIIPC